MRSKAQEKLKDEFKRQLRGFVKDLKTHISTPDDQWTIKGFVDVFKNIYTISADTKIVSKILEIHLFPKLLEFAKKHKYRIVLAEQQNYYPDLSFVHAKDEGIKFALDLKTTYRLLDNPDYCNGFTLGSHGEYFTNRKSHKNIQFPYEEYLGHFCLGIIYSRSNSGFIDETRSYNLSQLKSIVSVIGDFQFFAHEKWEIASDYQGSSNTANIGSITKINDILNGNGVFKNLGELWFDDYWINYGKIQMTLPDGKVKKITLLKNFLVYRGQDPQLANPMARKPARKKRQVQK
ncbi:MAG: EcoRV family type II restriction endonuclease [Anaerolineales bacterium]|nr:EcoRV family type II restriction endonuclease [Anaerolineales bacterium]